MYENHMYLISNVDNFATTSMMGIRPVWNSEYREFERVMKEWRAQTWELMEETKAEIEANPEAYKDDLSAIPTLLRSQDLKLEDGSVLFDKVRQSVSDSCVDIT